MKKFLTMIVLIVMLMSMLIPTAFAEEQILAPAGEETPFTEKVPVLKGISADPFGGVTVEWEPVKGAEEYALYRKKAGEASWSRWGFTEDTFYRNKNLEIGQTYIYTVRAFKNNREIRSKYDQKGLMITATPKVLSLTSAKNIGLEAISLAWKKQDGSVQYRIDRREDGGKWKTVKTLSNAASWTDTTVENGTKYTYRIRAERTVSGKKYTTAIDNTGKTVTCSNSTTVQLKSIEKGLNAAKLTWKSQVGADKYYVYRRIGSGAWKYIGAAAGTSYTDTALQNGKTYSYTVRGVKQKADGVITSRRDTNGLKVLATAKVAPKLKNAENTGLEAVTLKWGKVLGADSYRVYRKIPGGEYQLLKSGITGTSYTDKTAKNGKTYIYTVSAYRVQDGKKYYSQKATDALKIKSAPVEKVQLRSISKGFNAAKITWRAVAGADSYHVLRKTQNGKWQYIAKNVKGTSYIDETQKTKTTYSYSVRAVKTISNGTKILTGYDRTGLSAKATVPSTVAMKSAEKVRFRTAKITWKSVLGADGYGVYRRTSRGEWKWLANVTGTQYTDRTSEMDVKYYYSVRAYRVYDGKKSWSGRDNTGIALTLKSDVDPKKPMIALTYDDGPGKYTGKVLDVLEKYDAHATFFVVGRNVAKNSSTLKRAHNLGCEIGNHSYTHPALTSISNSKIDSEIGKTDAAIRKAIGTTPVLLRPPYGAQSDRVRARVDKAFIMWSVDTRDWEHHSVSKNLASVKKNAKDGAVILMHDIHKSTADAAESIVSYLTKRGYQLVTVSELAYYKGYDLKNGKSYSRFY